MTGQINKNMSQDITRAQQVATQPSNRSGQTPAAQQEARAVNQVAQQTVQAQQTASATQTVAANTQHAVASTSQGASQASSIVSTTAPTQTPAQPARATSVHTQQIADNTLHVATTGPSRVVLSEETAINARIREIQESQPEIVRGFKKNIDVINKREGDTNDPATIKQREDRAWLSAAMEISNKPGVELADLKNIQKFIPFRVLDDYNYELCKSSIASYNDMKTKIIAMSLPARKNELLELENSELQKLNVIRCYFFKVSKEKGLPTEGKLYFERLVSEYDRMMDELNQNIKDHRRMLNDFEFLNSVYENLINTITNVAKTTKTTDYREIFNPLYSQRNSLLEARGRLMDTSTEVRSNFARGNEKFINQNLALVDAYIWGYVDDALKQEKLSNSRKLEIINDYYKIIVADEVHIKNVDVASVVQGLSNAPNAAQAAVKIKQLQTQMKPVRFVGPD